MKFIHVIPSPRPVPSRRVARSTNELFAFVILSRATRGTRRTRRARGARSTHMIGAHTILAPLLARALNRYLDGVNSDTLRIALLRRKLSLRNVSVNCDALNRELNLGIKLTRVRIETIDVHYAVFGKR